MNATPYQTPSDVDQMLSAFFKSELPDPFPGLKLSGRAELPMPAASNRTGKQRRSSIAQSRLSLAASVALVIGGCWYLSSHIGAPADHPAISKDNLTATLPKEILKAQEKTKNPKMP